MIKISFDVYSYGEKKTVPGAHLCVIETSTPVYQDNFLALREQLETLANEEQLEQGTYEGTFSRKDGETMFDQDTYTLQGKLKKVYPC